MSKSVNVVTKVGMECIHLDTIDLKGFCELLSRLSVKLDLPDNAPTLLYSGPIVDGVGALDAVRDVEGVRLIRNTAPGDFMESDEAVLIMDLAKVG